VNSHELVVKHFHESRSRTLKKLTFQLGTPEAAEDVLQDAYYRALKYFKSYDGRNFDFWFNRIVRSCMIDYKNAEAGYSPEEADPEEQLVECPSYPNHVMREVFELIDTKSVVQMEVLNLYYRCEYSTKDISQITEYSYAQCHKIISRFREELRELYK
jgi:RNA polymerase sigma factor (sigma-70 family)